MQKLPLHIKEIWFDIISSLIKSRITGLPNEIKVNVFCELENYRNKPETLHNVFMNQAVEALDQLSSFNEVGTVIINEYKIMYVCVHIYICMYNIKHVSEVYMHYINLPRGKISPEGIARG